jgi:hypothetical protein
VAQSLAVHPEQYDKKRIKKSPKRIGFKKENWNFVISLNHLKKALK